MHPATLLGDMRDSRTEPHPLPAVPIDGPAAGGFRLGALCGSDTHAREAGHGTPDAHDYSGRVAVASLEPEDWIIVEMWVDQAMLSPA